MTNWRQNRITKIRLGILCLFFGFVSCFIFLPLTSSKTFVSDLRTDPATDLETPARAEAGGVQRFKDFPHAVRQHSRLNCSACHKFPSSNWRRVRPKDEAFPDITEYPKHESCLSCHRREFYSRARPAICSICHSNSSPRNNTRHPFPNPRETFDKTAKGRQAVSDFAIFFPHDKHIEIVSGIETGPREFIRASFTDRKRAAEESCAVCHKTLFPQGDSDDEYLTKPPADLGDRFWLKKGTFKSSPTSHATCFTCHSSDSGIEPAPANCAACHKPAPKRANTDFDAKFAVLVGNLDKITLDAWIKRDSSATFRHEFSSHAEMECASCHNAAGMNTLDAATKKVAISSCNLCHITETLDDGGILNYEIDQRKKDAKFQCVKCHLSYGRLPIPESHFKAIAGQ